MKKLLIVFLFMLIFINYSNANVFDYNYKMINNISNILGSSISNIPYAINNSGSNTGFNINGSYIFAYTISNNYYSNQYLYYSNSTLFGAVNSSDNEFYPMDVEIGNDTSYKSEKVYNKGAYIFNFGNTTKNNWDKNSMNFANLTYSTGIKIITDRNICKLGNCINFTGSVTSNAFTKDGINGTQNITLALWIYRNTVPTSDDAVYANQVSTDAGKPNNWIFENPQYSNETRFRGHGDIDHGLDVFTINCGNITLNEWHYIVITINETIGKCYVGNRTSNGMQLKTIVNSVGNERLFDTMAQNLSLGSLNSVARYFNGLMDNFQIYSEPKSEQWINATFNYTKSNILSNTVISIMNTTYENQIYETQNTRFNISIFYNTSFINYISPVLNYNNYIYSMSYLNMGINTYGYSDINIPLIINSSNNITIPFFFNMTISLFNGTTDYFTINGSQFVKRLVMDNCTVYSNNILNVSFIDEQLLTAVNGNLKITFFIFKGTTNYRSVNFSFMNKTLIPFCIPSGINYTVNIFGQYNGTIYSTRDYIDDNMILTGTTPIIKILYLLSTTSTTQIPLIITQGAVLLPGTTINIYRFYPDLGSYLEVADAKTDATGTAYINLETNSPYYQIWILDNGNLIYTTESQKLTSTGMTVSISGGIDNSYKIVGNIYASCVKDYNLSIIQCTYTDASSLPANYIFNVTYPLPVSLGIACSSISNTPTGTFICDLSSMSNGTYFISLIAKYNYGSSYSLWNDIFTKGFVNRLGDAGIFLSMIIFLMLFFAGIYSKSGAMLLGILGLVICSWLQILPVEPSAIIGLFFTVVILIWKSTRNKGG